MPKDTYRRVDVDLLSVVRELVLPERLLELLELLELRLLVLVAAERDVLLLLLLLERVLVEGVRFVLVVPEVRTRVVVVLDERVEVAGCWVAEVVRELLVVGLDCVVVAVELVVRVDVVGSFCVAADCVRWVVEADVVVREDSAVREPVAGCAADWRLVVALLVDVERVLVVVRDAPDCSTACCS